MLTVNLIRNRCTLIELKFTFQRSKLLPFKFHSINCTHCLTLILLCCYDVTRASWRHKSRPLYCLFRTLFRLTGKNKCQISFRWICMSIYFSGEHWLDFVIFCQTSEQIDCALHEILLESSLNTLCYTYPILDTCLHVCYTLCIRIVVSISRGYTNNTCMLEAVLFVYPLLRTYIWLRSLLLNDKLLL